MSIAIGRSADNAPGWGARVGLAAEVALARFAPRVVAWAVSSVTVYGCYGSFCTQKVYLTLAAKRVEAARRNVNIGPPMENYEPWYARINPNMVVPTLDHDGTIVCNSSTIIRYIDEHFDGPALMPNDPVARADVERWIERIDALRIRELSYGRMRGIMARLRDRIIMPRRVKMLRRYQARSPELADAYQRRIDDVERWIDVMRRPVDIERLREDLLAVLDDLEAALGQHSLVVGEGYTLADVMATVLVARVKVMRFADLERWPAIGTYYARMKQRPQFPADDIVDKLDKQRLFALVGPFLLGRVAVAAVVLAAIVGAWAMIR